MQTLFSQMEPPLHDEPAQHAFVGTPHVGAGLSGAASAPPLDEDVEDVDEEDVEDVVPLSV